MTEASHPDQELFDYMTSRLKGDAAYAVEAHLAGCSECTEFVRSVSFLRDFKAEPAFHEPSAAQHPTIAQLAEFFYGLPSSEDRGTVAGHVAVCTDCADEIAQYTATEHAANNYQVSRPATAKVPDAAWELIRDWEDSVFSKPKEAHPQISDDLLKRLSALIESKSEMGSKPATAESPDMIPVTVVDGSGRVQGVELFRRVSGKLEHADQSERWHEKPVHTLMDFESGQRVLVSTRVKRHCIELTKDESNATAIRTTFFIIDE